jgi:hypothetical protein
MGVVSCGVPMEHMEIYFMWKPSFPMELKVYKDESLVLDMAYLDTKEHKDWARLVKERDGHKCIVCNSTNRISAHHLIPKEIEEFRSNINNGVTLCAKHHMRFGFGLSPHSHGSALFFIWLMRNRPYILNWIEENWNGDSFR